MQFLLDEQLLDQSLLDFSFASQSVSLELGQLSVSLSLCLFFELGLELSLADLFLTGLSLGCGLFSVKSLLLCSLKFLLLKLDLSLALGLLQGDSHSLLLFCLQPSLLSKTGLFSLLGSLLSGLSGLFFESLGYRFIG